MRCEATRLSASSAPRTMNDSMSVTLKMSIPCARRWSGVFRRAPLLTAMVVATAVGCSNPSDVSAPPTSQPAVAIEKARDVSAEIDARTRKQLRTLDEADAD